MMLGDPSCVPFIGHFRINWEGPSAWLSAAGRIGAQRGIEDAWLPARQLEGVLQKCGDSNKHQSDRHVLLRRLWEALNDVESDLLGPEQGEDLCMLLVAGDARGVGVAGVGLSGVWGDVDGRWAPLVESNHPLLTPTGRPKGMPGVLTLDLKVSAVVATPAHLPSRLPTSSLVRAHSGVHT